MKKLRAVCLLLGICVLLSSIGTSAAAGTGKLAVAGVSDVWTLDTQYEFAVRFNCNISDDAHADQNAEETDLTMGKIIDHILINGKSLRSINATAVDQDGNALATAISVRVDKPRDYTDYSLEFYFKKSLSANYNLKLDGTDTITFRKGLEFTYGGVLDENVSYRYDADNGSWSKMETNTSVYRDTRVTLVEFAANSDGSKNNAAFYIQFDKPASYQLKPYISSCDTYWNALISASAVNYTAKELDDIRSLGIRDAILDDIRLDGQSVRELLASETGVTTTDKNTGEQKTLTADYMRQIGITANYEGSGYQGGKVLGIYFNSLSSHIPDLSQTHTLTIAAGFVTPLFTQTGKTQTFIWLPAYKVWMPEATAGKYL